MELTLGFDLKAREVQRSSTTSLRTSTLVKHHILDGSMEDYPLPKGRKQMQYFALKIKNPIAIDLTGFPYTNVRISLYTDFQMVI